MRHFASSIADFPFTHTKVYIAASALVINIVISVVLTFVLRALKAPAGADETQPGDYVSDAPASKVPATTTDELTGHEAAGSG
jgi:SSS family solute:Na+ symporter